MCAFCRNPVDLFTLARALAIGQDVRKFAAQTFDEAATAWAAAKAAEAADGAAAAPPAGADGGLSAAAASAAAANASSALSLDAVMVDVPADNADDRPEAKLPSPFDQTAPSPQVFSHALRAAPIAAVRVDTQTCLPRWRLLRGLSGLCSGSGSATRRATGCAWRAG